MTPTAETQADQIRFALSKYWGFTDLRALQGEVVEAALKGRDAVVVMPTGGGKSLCFQLPAVITDSLTVVVSPLIALMKDQVDALRVVGIEAAALNSSLNSQEEAQIVQSVADGKLRLLYVSPERLLLSSTMRLLASANGGKGVSRFAIDEAHCISAWGHDFRPEFRQLNRIKEAFPGISVQAFTATATPKVQRDIAIQLKLERPRKFVGTFDRPNLTYRVVAKDDPIRRTVEAVKRYPDEGVIVYCLSRKDTETIANALVAQKIPAAAYHAGLPPETRKKVSEDFAQEKTNIVVATIAFGMGIDRGNVRCVIHECLPKSMEGYQQETGRAGRDGLPSECVLLYSHGDVVRLRRLLTDGDAEISAHHASLLEEVRRFATSHQCRHKTLSEHFGQPYEVASEGCGACDVCLGGMKPLANGGEIGRQILATAMSVLALGRGRSFGVGLLAGVLTGSRAKNVLERRGDEADGFGKFAGMSTDRVTSLVHQLTDLGLLDVSEGQYPVLSVTSSGITAVRDGLEIELIENEALIAPAKKSKGSDAGVEYDESLFEKLRSWRRSIAADRGVPAYVVFHDATLMRIAGARPSSIDRLRSITGVGDRRANEFGDELIAVVKAYAQESGVMLDQSLEKTAPSPTQPVSMKTASYAVFFEGGDSIEQTASKLGVKESTVWAHLAAWIENSKPTSISLWVDDATYKKVESAMAGIDPEFLKPIYDALEGSVSYEVIRAARAFVRSKEA